MCLAPCCRSIVILESNIGQSQLHKMLMQAGDRKKVTTLHVDV